MPAAPITFRVFPGLQMSTMRAVGLLEGYKELNAARAYESLAVTAKRQINKHIERWTAGHDQPKTWFHGFPSLPEYKECFVFKYREHRFYGFLCNPRPKSAPRFRLCVLTTHDEKYEWETDEAILPRVAMWRSNLASRAAIGYLFAEFQPEGKQWTN